MESFEFGLNRLFLFRPLSEISDLFRMDHGLQDLKAEGGTFTVNTGHLQFATHFIK